MKTVGHFCFVPACLSRAELLQQIVDYLSKSGQAKEVDLQTALATLGGYADGACAWRIRHGTQRNESYRTVSKLLSELSGKDE